MKYLDDIICGDCCDLIPTLDDASIGLCVTSPPYANQRSGGSCIGTNLYQGVSEKDFPAWTAKWMSLLKPKLLTGASVFIVIRPHIRDGEISDYVLRTRLAVRESGWKECEELIWYKPDGPPLGSISRPRRTYESILWYSLTGKPFVDLLACGNKQSVRTGGFAGSERFGEGVVIAKGQEKELKKGTSRISDVLSVAIGTLPKGVMHPAMFPGGVAELLIQSFSRVGDTVLDPFMGSGQTALAALAHGRHFTGLEMDQKFVDMAKNRVQQAIQPTKNVVCSASEQPNCLVDHQKFSEKG